MDIAGIAAASSVMFLVVSTPTYLGSMFVQDLVRPQAGVKRNHASLLASGSKRRYAFKVDPSAAAARLAHSSTYSCLLRRRLQTERSTRASFTVCGSRLKEFRAFVVLHIIDCLMAVCTLRCLLQSVPVRFRQDTDRGPRRICVVAPFHSHCVPERRTALRGS